jgi:hypothetical protein
MGPEADDIFASFELNDVNKKKYAIVKDKFDNHLIVGAYGANPNGIDSGKAYIIFGKTDTNAVDLAKLGGDCDHYDHLPLHH